MDPLHKPRGEVRDVVPAPFSVRVLGGIVASFGLSLIVGNIVIGFDGPLVTSAAIGSAAGVAVLFARVSTRVAGGQVTVWFVPLLRIRVSLADVREVSVEGIDPRRTGGVGIARYRGGRVLCVSAGRGVRFSSRAGSVLVQCDDPEVIADALKRK